MPEYMGFFSNGIAASQQRLERWLAHPSPTVDRQCVAIVRQIMDFQRSLDADREVVIQLASFGHTVTLSTCNIRVDNPDLIIFDGFVGEERATLIQHATQINFLLVASRKMVLSQPAHKIGFVIPNEDCVHP